MISLESLKQSVRWQDWAQAKLPLLCTVMGYLMLATGPEPSSALADFVLFLLFSVCSSVYGYLVNDLFDIDEDRAHARRNVFSSLGFGRGALIVSAVLLVSIAAGSRFAGNSWFIPLWALWFTIASGYSARPVRLKERGILGLCAACSAQYPIPILLCFAAFDRFGDWDMLAVVLCATLGAAAAETGHQRYDMFRRRGEGDTPCRIRYGVRGLERLYSFLVYTNILSVLGMMIVMAPAVDGIRLPLTGVSVLAIPMTVHVLLMVLTISSRVQRNGALEDTYYMGGKKDVLHITYILFPNFFLPCYLFCALLLVDVRYGLCLAVFLLITYTNYPRAGIVWPVRICFRELRNVISKT